MCIVSFNIPCLLDRQGKSDLSFDFNNLYMVVTEKKQSTVIKHLYMILMFWELTTLCINKETEALGDYLKAWVVLYFLALFSI